MTARFVETRRKLRERLRLKRIPCTSFCCTFVVSACRRLVGRIVRGSTGDHHNHEDQLDLVDFEHGGLLMAEALADHLRGEVAELHDLHFVPESAGSTFTVPWSATTPSAQVVRGRVLVMSLLDQDAIDVRALVVVDSPRSPGSRSGSG